jgi:hypothetical protein
MILSSVESGVAGLACILPSGTVPPFSPSTRGRLRHIVSRGILGMNRVHSESTAVEILCEAAPIKRQKCGKQCEQRWDGNMGQSAISCADRRQASPEARLHRLTHSKQSMAKLRAPPETALKAGYRHIDCDAI